MNYEKDFETEQYYDPEIISILLTALAALGSASAIIGTTLGVVEFHESRQSKALAIHNAKLHKESIRQEVKNVLRSLENSVTAIKRGLKDLDDIYRISSRISERNIVEFGNGCIWLNQFQNETFSHIQSQILLETQRIHTDLRYVEELLLSGEKRDIIEDMVSNARTRYYLEDVTAPVNRLLSGFGRLDISEFTNEAITVCHRVEEAIEGLENNLRRNFNDL